jgi:hypothetical protein
MLNRRMGRVKPASSKAVKVAKTAKPAPIKPAKSKAKSVMQASATRLGATTAATTTSDTGDKGGDKGDADTGRLRSGDSDDEEGGEVAVAKASSTSASSTSASSTSASSSSSSSSGPAHALVPGSVVAVSSNPDVTGATPGTGFNWSNPLIPLSSTTSTTPTPAATPTPSGPAELPPAPTHSAAPEHLLSPATLSSQPVAVSSQKPGVDEVLTQEQRGQNQLQAIHDAAPSSSTMLQAIHSGNMKAPAFEHTVRQEPDEPAEFSTTVPTTHVPYLQQTIDLYIKGWRSEECLAAVMLRKQVNMTIRAKRKDQWKLVGTGTSTECVKDPNRMVREQLGGNEKVTDLKNGADYISTHFPGMIRAVKCTLDWTDKRRTCLAQWYCTGGTNDDPSCKPTAADASRLLESSRNMREFLAGKEAKGYQKQRKADKEEAKFLRARAEWDAAQVKRQQGGGESDSAEEGGEDSD